MKKNYLDNLHKIEKLKNYGFEKGFKYYYEGYSGFI